jgi:hypothetical protein
MTGREAIHAVRMMPEARASALARTSSDPMLRRVCSWVKNDPDGWAALLEEIGTPLGKEEPRGAVLDRLWRERLWSDQDIAIASGLTLRSIAAFKRTRYRGATWATKMVGKHQKAYQLIATRQGGRND